MRTFLGLDLGTSATKGVILASDGRVIARARARHPDSRRGGVGRADPSAWEASILAVCRQLAPQLAEVSGIGLDTHCPTIVPMGDDGHPVTLAVTWDNPALTTYFDHYSPLRSTMAIRSTGNHPSRSTFAAIAYHYLREAEPDAFTRMTTLGFAGTWLGQQLTGEAAIDPTQASYTACTTPSAGTPTGCPRRSPNWTSSRPCCRRSGRRWRCWATPAPTSPNWPASPEEYR